MVFKIATGSASETGNNGSRRFVETVRKVTGHGVFAVALQRVARDIGRPSFPLQLLEFVGALIAHDTGWIVRYDPFSAPDVLFTKAISPELVSYYLDTEPEVADPYLCSWRSGLTARIETLAEAMPSALNPNFYVRDFKIRADFTDELAMFLPAPGASCFSLFLERRDGHFRPTELRRARSFFPAILELHKAHVRALLGDMATKAVGCQPIEELPMLVMDRSGRSVYATDRWSDAVQQDPALLAFALASSAAGDRGSAEFEGTMLGLHALDQDNSIAPGGRLICMPKGGLASDPGDDCLALAMVGKLSPRERQILLLTLDGRNTGEIAQSLALTKGYIKNCRLRMYRKFGVSSERSMIALLTPVKGQLAGRRGSEFGHR